MASSEYVQWFRGSTPYISAYRNKTFVILLPGEAIEHVNLTNIVHDLALLHVLGVRLVLVHGARSQIAQALPDSKFHQHRRITPQDDMPAIAGIHGQIRTQLEALFSTGLPNSPLHNVDIPVISGNFVVAQPIGILDGVDHLCTGSIRRIETSRIDAALAQNCLVVQSPLGFSPSGQAFNLAAEDLATAMAVALKADKLLAFNDLAFLTDEEGNRISTLSPAALQEYAHTLPTLELTHKYNSLAKAVINGVQKAQLISYVEDGAVLSELFTANGHGTQIVQQSGRAIRTAKPTDVPDIVEIIRPLEEEGVLVRRDRDRLEQEVEHFLVAEVDGIVVGCCALYMYDDSAELACIAVHENYRNAHNANLGQQLLHAAQQRAHQQGAGRLFVLTTQTRDWFIDQGFTDATPEQLPTKKQEMYNWQRNSKVMEKLL